MTALNRTNIFRLFVFSITWLLLAVVVTFAEVNITSHERSFSPLRPSTHMREKGLQVEVKDRQTMAASVADQMRITKAPLFRKCLNGGVWNSTRNACRCHGAFSGEKCEMRVCLNGGWLVESKRLCRCNISKGGHCEQTVCDEGAGKCHCINNYFGPSCKLLCVHGRVIDGRCVCFEDYGDCGEVPHKRRPIMQSRFALSGLSLCLITIILLWISVVTRRRRAMIAASHFERIANERLLRNQQHRFCEHRVIAFQPPRSSRIRSGCEFRQFLQTTRNTNSRLLANSLASPNSPYSRTPDMQPRSDTPPPVYCATPEEAPPTYEEAVAGGRATANVEK